MAPLEVLQNVKDEQGITQPIVIVMKDDLVGDQHFVLVDREFVRAGPTMVSALRLLIQVHYVFLLQYDVNVRNLYRCFETLYGLQGLDRKPTVSDLLQVISDYERQFF